MNLYSVTIFDRKAPNSEFRVAFWASDLTSAHRKGLECGRVLSVERILGSYLQARDAERRMAAGTKFASA